MQHGVVAGYPVKDLQVRLFDGQYHRVDSSENAFKVAGSMAFEQAMEEADPCCWSRSCCSRSACPRTRWAT